MCESASEKTISFTQAVVRRHPGKLSTEFVHNHVDKGAPAGANAEHQQGLASSWAQFRQPRPRAQSPAPPLNIVAVTRLRPECLLR
jgi:hypothetical protein